MAWTCLVRNIRYFIAYFRAPSKTWQSPTVARIYSRHPVMYNQDKVCIQAECVLFSQSLVPRQITKAYFLQHNAGCYQLCNNPRFPVVRGLWKLKSCALIQWPTGWLGSSLQIALDPHFKHVRSFINKGHLALNATKLPVLLFHLEKLRFCARSLYWCSSSLWRSREKPPERSTQKKTQV